MALRDRLKDIVGKPINVHNEEGGKEIEIAIKSRYNIAKVEEDCIVMNNGDVIAIDKIMSIIQLPNVR